MLGAWSLLRSVRARVFYWWKQQPTVLHIGVYAGSSWDVPTSQRSHALDRAIEKFEKSHPHVRVEYENGIPQIRLFRLAL